MTHQGKILVESFQTKQEEKRKKRKISRSFSSLTIRSTFYHIKVILDKLACILSQILEFRYYVRGLKEREEHGSDSSGQTDDKHPNVGLKSPTRPRWPTHGEAGQAIHDAYSGSTNKA